MTGRQRSKREQELRDRLYVLLTMADEVAKEIQRVAGHVDRGNPAQRRQRLHSVK